MNIISVPLLIRSSQGYVKSAIHRVVRPPPDQAHLERLGMFFFMLKPSISPVLKREGLWTKEDDEFPVEDTATCGGATHHSDDLLIT